MIDRPRVLYDEAAGSMFSGQIDVLVSYVPSILCRRLIEEPTRQAGPSLDRYDTAVLFADISGFTRLTERLADRGPGGLEELTSALNVYFDRLIERIAAHGGDVVKMAGDALVALWPAVLGEETLDSATKRAARCALDVQERLQNFEVAEGIQLTAKIAIAAGELALMQVGGQFDRWELLLAGAPLAQMGAAERLARPGDVVISPEAWSILKPICTGDPLDLGCVRLTAIDIDLPIRPLVVARPGSESEPSLRSYLPGAIRARLSAGQTGWLAELRRLTVLFVNLPGIDIETPEALPRTQEIVQAVQAALYRYEGSLNKLSVDEKGTMVVAAMGLPPLAHHDDPKRGVQAALEIREALARLNVACSIGIATGRVYCGEVGNDRRREYTILGRFVNLAARLMGAASHDHDLFCDDATFRAIRGDFHFDALPAVKLKNIEQPVPLYRPRGRAPASNRSRPMVGREPERVLLADRLERLHAGRGGVVLLEGEPGIGKSQIIAEIVRCAQAEGIAVLAGGGDAIERSTPYQAWRTVVARLLDLGEKDDVEFRRDRLLERVGDLPGAEALAPLLGGLVSIDLPDNDLTIHLAGQVRADNTNELLVRLIESKARQGPTLLIVEDVHWIDSASWALLLRVVRERSSTLLIASARPNVTTFPEEYAELLAHPDVWRVRLEGLTSDETQALIRQRLGLVDMPDEIGRLIHEKAQGNPFFTEELAYAARDSGLLVFEGDRCRIAPGVDLDRLAIPDQVEGVINYRLDRLSPSQGLALKVASVIGRFFAFRLLHDVYPIEPDRSELTGDLSALSELELILEDKPETDTAYLFRHVITRDVVYDLMPFAQRRRLHRAVAEWYEQTQTRDLSAFHPLLAHHWSYAGEDHRSLDYFDKAGDAAFRAGAYQEAVGFLEKAVELQVKEGLGSEPARLARWEFQLAEAQLALGNLVRSREHTDRALRLLGGRIPSLARMPFSFLRQIGLLILHMRASRRNRSVDSSGPARLAEQRKSDAYRHISQLCYFDQNKVLGVYSAIRALNHAESIGPSAELARSLALMCLAAGLVPAHGLAAMYDRRSLEVANRLDDPAARAWVLQLTGMYHLGVGHWDLSRPRLEEAVAINKKLGDWRHWEESSGELARLDYYVGAFEPGAERFREFGEAALRLGHIQAGAWGLHGRAKILLRLGRPQESLALLEKSKALPAQAVGIGDAILREGLLAFVYRDLGDLGAARSAADETMRLVRLSPPIVSYTLEGYSGAAETFLSSWEATPTSNENRNISINKAWDAVKALNEIARVFPVGRPRAGLCRGTALWLSGRPRSAHRAWLGGLRVAERLGMPYEQGRILHEIARHRNPADPVRDAELQRALTIFDRLGSLTDAGRVRSELGR